MFQHPGALPHVLAPPAYFAPDYFERERERVFAPHWNYAAPAEHLARDGDTVARDVQGTPVLIRNAAGRLRAFRNVCSHRHSLVVPPGRARCEPLRCRYHGWEYDDDGRVARIPDGPSFRGMREPRALDEFAVERLGGVVLVNLAPGAPSLAAALGGFADEIDRFFGRHRLVWEWTTEHAVNWKVIAENAVESYHVPVTHPATFRDYRPEELHDHALDKRYTRYRDLLPWGTRPVERLMVGAARLLLPEGRVERFTQAHVFPNFLLYYGELFSSFIALEPLSATRTRHVQLGFVPRALRHPALRPLQSLFARGLVGGVRRVMREDMALWSDVQHGLEHSVGAGLLSRREERVHAFQRWVADQVASAGEVGDGR
jgi:phenylpropionate dioxygenase-like ring-hydroxylating dioxygenase large terminal subunit